MRLACWGQDTKATNAVAPHPQTLTQKKKHTTSIHSSTHIPFNILRSLLTIWSYFFIWHCTSTHTDTTACLSTVTESYGRQYRHRVSGGCETKFAEGLPPLHKRQYRHWAADQVDSILIVFCLALAACTHFTSNSNRCGVVNGSRGRVCVCAGVRPQQSFPGRQGGQLCVRTPKTARWQRL